MLDSQGRIVIKEELMKKDEYVGKGKEINIFYDSNQKRICIRSCYCEQMESAYWIGKYKIDKKGRVCIPASIRNAFPGATYLPAEKNGRIYILIIEHEKKSE